jgi:hypothetical protein
MSTPADTTPAPAAPHVSLLAHLESFIPKFESKVGLAEHEMPLAADTIKGILAVFTDIEAMIAGLHQPTVPTTGGQQ